MGLRAFSLFLLFSGAAHAAPSQLLSASQSLEDYADVKQVAQELIRRYPPDQYVYVGMGRSPTSVIAMLKAVLGDGAAVNVPMSGMAGFEPSSPRYTTEAVTNLRRSFDRFIPSQTSLGGKKLVVIDFSAFGQSIPNGQRELVDYLRARNPASPTAVRAVALGHSGVLQSLRSRGVDGIELSTRFWRRLFDSAYHPVTEYGEFDPTRSALLDPEARNPSFRRVVETFRRRAGQDREFMRFVRQATTATSSSLLSSIASWGRSLGRRLPGLRVGGLDGALMNTVEIIRGQLPAEAQRRLDVVEKACPMFSVTRLLTPRIGGRVQAEDFQEGDCRDAVRAYLHLGSRLAFDPAALSSREDPEGDSDRRVILEGEGAPSAL